MKYRLLRTRSGMARVLLYLVLVLACWELYHYVSLIAPRHTAIAHQHAAALIALEQRLGILFEPHMQHFALYHANPRIWGRLLNNAAVRGEVEQIYTGGQIPWLASMLIWAALFRPRYVKRLCILAILGSLIGITIAELYPVAPPRFAMAGPPYFIEDVNMMSSPEQMLVRYGGFDPYAAMPSLHVLWGLITGFGLFLGSSRWTLRALATIFPLTIAADVIITGNHYVLDCVASMLVFSACLAGYGACLFLVRVRRRPTVPECVPSHPERFLGRERRVAPNLRPLDFPILLCIVSGVVMLLSADDLQRALGSLLVGAGALAAPIALRRINVGILLRDSTPTAEWFSGFLLIAGATTLGASDLFSRSAGSLCWVIAALLPLLARMRAETLAVGLLGDAACYPLEYNAAGKRSPGLGYLRVRKYMRGYLKSGQRSRKARIEGPSAEDA